MSPAFDPLPFDPTVHGAAPGLPDEIFDHDGLITKRHVRAAALAFLRPAPGALLWDLGAGSGAVSIEWALAGGSSRAIGVERDPERAERARRNADGLGVADRVQIIDSVSSDVIGDLPTPDAVFIGGGAEVEVIDRCVAALAAGGRIVVHAVTLDTEQIIVDAARRHGGELSRMEISSIDPVGRYLAWRPARPITQWALVKPHSTSP